jgi:hypothetical protein
VCYGYGDSRMDGMDEGMGWDMLLVVHDVVGGRRGEQPMSPSSLDLDRFVFVSPVSAYQETTK